MDDVATAAVELCDDLHEWLRRRNPLAAVAIGGLTFELVAIVGMSANSMADAEDVIDTWAATMKEQVRYFGVGEHESSPSQASQNGKTPARHSPSLHLVVAGLPTGKRES